MSLPKDWNVRYVTNAALPYAPHIPFSREPVYVAGQNVLTSYLQQIAVLRPGFDSAFEAAATMFAGSIRRLFGWRRWGADFYLMANVIVGNDSIVYKLKVGTDASFVQIWASPFPEPFDFTVSNNRLYFGNGVNMLTYDGTSVRNWGIIAPWIAPTATVTTGTGLSATVGYVYVYCFGNSSTGHVSSPSPPSATTGIFTDEQVTVAGVGLIADGVDEIKIFRTTDGGSGISFLLATIANPGGGSWSYDDTTTDINLGSTRAPVANQNDLPTPSMGLVTFAGRIWGFKDNKLYFSNYEEQGDLGVEEESFAATNFFPFRDEITGLGQAGRFLIVTTRGHIYRIDGDSLDTFARELLFAGIGCGQRASICAVGKSMAWFDNAGKTRITDGITQQEFSQPIRIDLLGVDQAQLSMTYHNGPSADWMILCDGGRGKLFVYSLEANQWMPPWTAAGTFIASVETAAGVKDLLLGASTKKVLKLSRGFDAFNDEGVNYAGDLTTNLFPVTDSDKPGSVGSFEYVVLERNVVAPTDVLQNTDDHPVVGAFTSIVANIQSPVPLRSQGATLLEDWYYSKTPVARRIALKFTWAAAGTQFGIIGFGVAGREMQK